MELFVLPQLKWFFGGTFSVHQFIFAQMSACGSHTWRSHSIKYSVVHSQRAFSIENENAIWSGWQVRMQIALVRSLYLSIVRPFMKHDECQSNTHLPYKIIGRNEWSDFCHAQCLYVHRLYYFIIVCFELFDAFVRRHTHTQTSPNWARSVSGRKYLLMPTKQGGRMTHRRTYDRYQGITKMACCHTKIRVPFTTFKFSLIVGRTIQFASHSKYIYRKEDGRNLWRWHFQNNAHVAITQLYISNVNCI